MPTLTVSNSPVVQNQKLDFTFSGFQKGQPVDIFVEDQFGQGVAEYYIEADTNGAGGSSFFATESPGNYTLVATDNFYHTANTNFTIVATGGGGGGGGGGGQQPAATGINWKAVGITGAVVLGVIVIGAAVSHKR